MQTKIVFHASPKKIDSFDIPYNGLHLGTKESALEAATYHHKWKDISNNTIYLHEILLEVNNVEDVLDVGYSWREYLNNDKSKVFSYTNKYEESTDKSYVIFSTKYILKVLSCQEVKVYED